MVGWYHQLNGYEFAQTLGDGEGQGSLVCCSPWVLHYLLEFAQILMPVSKLCPLLWHGEFLEWLKYRRNSETAEVT